MSAETQAAFEAAVRAIKSPQRQAFVREYLVDLNATQAAIRAGYSPKTAEQQGPRLLGFVEVAAAVQLGKDARAERLDLTTDYVVRSIMDTMERCKQAVPVKNPDGSPVLVELPTGDIAPAYTFDATNVLKGAQLLGNHLGMFEKKVKHDVADPLVALFKEIASRGSKPPLAGSEPA